MQRFELLVFESTLAKINIAISTVDTYGTGKYNMEHLIFP